jgi:hypothetical protein
LHVKRRFPLATRTLCWLTLVALCAGLAGCNFIDIVLGKHASLDKMVPGDSVGGDFNCWLTMEFDRYPEGVDPTDVHVRFTSVALEQEAVFDWDYIAEHDYLARSAGAKFGSGNVVAEDTSAGAPPPLAEAIKVRFPLEARSVIEDMPSTLYLQAELYWGGKKQDSVRRTIEHVYAREPGRPF